MSKAKYIKVDGYPEKLKLIEVRGKYLKKAICEKKGESGQYHIAIERTELASDQQKRKYFEGIKPAKYD